MLNPSCFVGDHICHILPPPVHETCVRELRFASLPSKDGLDTYMGWWPWIHLIGRDIYTFVSLYLLFCGWESDNLCFFDEYINRYVFLKKPMFFYNPYFNHIWCITKYEYWQMIRHQWHHEVVQPIRMEQPIALEVAQCISRCCCWNI